MRPIGNPECFAVRSEIISVLEFGDDLCIVYDVVGLQRPIHWRDCYGCLTAPEKSIRDFFK